MTGTIEAVARAHKLLGRLPRSDFDDVLALLESERTRAIASHTKALIEGAGELEQECFNYGNALASTCGDAPWEQVVRDAAARILQAAATIAALRAENERLSAALHVIRRDVEVGIWCQSDIEWFVGEVLAGRQPDYLRALDVAAIARRDSALSDLIAADDHLIDEVK